MLHLCHARRYASGFFKDAASLSRRENEVGKRGTGPTPLNYLVRGAVSRAPPAFLPRRRTGPLPLVSVKARTWGFITQPRYRCATDPAPPPFPDPRFRTWVPARAMRKIMREEEWA